VGVPGPAAAFSMNPLAPALMKSIHDWSIILDHERQNLFDHI
jgi:hypothetical protein